jgi:hypothetical protein
MSKVNTVHFKKLTPHKGYYRPGMRDSEGMTGPQPQRKDSLATRHKQSTTPRDNTRKEVQPRGQKLPPNPQLKYASRNP